MRAFCGILIEIGLSTSSFFAATAGGGHCANRMRLGTLPADRGGFSSVVRWRLLGPFRVCLEDGLTAKRNHARRVQHLGAAMDAESLYRNLLRTSSEATFITSLDGEWLDCNQATAKLFGCDSREQLRRLPLNNLYADPKGRDAYLHALEERELVQDWQVELRRRDGSTFKALLTAVAIRDEEGRVVAEQGTIRDVSVSKEMEKVLQASEKHCRAVVENVNEAIVVAQDGMLTFVNPKACELSGYCREELTGKPFVKLLHPDDRALVVERHRERLEGSPSHAVYAFRILHKNGETKWAEINAVPITWEERPATLSLLTDITARREAEQALQESEERFRLLAESSADIIWQVGLDGQVLYASPAAERVFGYRPEEVPTLALERFFAESDLDRAGEAFAEALSGLEYGLLELEALGKDGAVIPIEVSVTPIVKDGAIVGVQGVARDITERKRAEKALRESQSRVKRKLESVLSPDGDLGALDLEDVIDVDAIQALMDDFHELTGIGIAIVNLEGEILVATGWQDICTRFHRVHPETRRHCIESDTALSSGIEPGTHKLYKCKNNMWDMATPIVVGGRHVGNLFLGQFFFEDEPVDRRFFRQQAQRYGFDEEAYLAALDEVPRWGKDRVETVFQFYTQLATMLSQLSHSNLKLARTLAEKDRLLKAHKQSERRFKSYIDHAPYGVFVVDREARIITANRETSSMTGYDHEELLTMHVRDLALDDPESAREHLQRVLDEDVSTDEFTILTKDGRTRWWSVRSVRLSEDRLLAYAADITERKEAHEALRESERGYRELLDSMSDGIAVVDTSFRVVRMNEALARDIGKREGVVGAKCFSAFYGFDEPCDWCPAQQVLRTGIDESATVGYPAEDPQRWFHLRASPIRNTAGEITHIVESARDITERIDLEEQLRQQERLAALGQLAGGVAHDFNNILATIILCAEMDLGRRDLNPAVQDGLETILGESRRAADLVQQILDFSRSSMLATEPLSLAEAVEETAVILRRTIPENIRVTTELGCDACTILGDATRVRQVLMNLALNAKDAMPDGGNLRIAVDALELSTEEKAPAPDMAPGHWVQLTVSDTGTGMTDEVQAHLFEPFFTTKEVGEGTGLGLAQVYGIVKQHDGFVDVDTAPGEGTTFSIFFPRIGREELTGEAAGAAGAPPAKADRILVVEEADPLRGALEAGLEAQGYQVTAVANGREAVEEMDVQEVDLLLTDVTEPRTGSDALLRAVRRRAPGLSIIAMTGLNTEANTLTLLAAGYSDVLCKPFSIEDLVTAVQGALDEPA